MRAHALPMRAALRNIRSLVSFERTLNQKVVRMTDVGRGRAALLAWLCCTASFVGCSDEPTPTGPGVTVQPPAMGSPISMPPVTAPLAGQAAPPVMGIAGSGPTVAPTAPPPVATSEMWCAVKRTLDSRCVACHNEQKVANAPMSLKTYADLQAPAFSDKAKRVYQLVGVRVHDTVKPMPPQEKLTAQQLNEIDTWVAAGAPGSADPTCGGSTAPEPSAPAWPDNCDETYMITAARGGRPNSVSAGMEAHPQIPVPAPWGSERVQAIAWRAITDNEQVLHHWILYGPSREFLFGWAPGKDHNEPLPPDVGVYLPSGNMTLDVHYNNTTGTQTEQDASGVEICVLKQANFRPKTATVADSLTSLLISIPAGAADQQVTGTCTHSGMPVRLLSVSPHAHRTAHHMKFTVQKANGEVITMHDESFNFEEQTTYPLNPPVIVESGDRIITTCTFTNDTDRTITFGENTGNEMCFNFALYEPMGGLNCGRGGFPIGGR